jgi:hypothetical protein
VATLVQALMDDPVNQFFTGGSGEAAGCCCAGGAAQGRGRAAGGAGPPAATTPLAHACKPRAAWAAQRPRQQRSCPATRRRPRPLVLAAGGHCAKYVRREVVGYLKALPKAAHFIATPDNQAVALWQLLPQETPRNELFAGWQRIFKVRGGPWGPWGPWGRTRTAPAARGCSTGSITSRGTPRLAPASTLPPPARPPARAGAGQAVGRAAAH